jgi:virulence factor Mce-like protein
MRRTHPVKLQLIGLGAVLAAALAFAAAFGLRPPGDGYEVTATFRDALNAKPGFTVRIAGVDVGEVTKVEHVGGGSAAARVTMSISDRGRPLHRDARFTLRPRIFLEGNLFVEVQPGSPTAPELGDGAVVPLAQTATFVPFSDITRLLRSDVRRDTRTVLAELDRALRGGGASSLSRALPRLAPALEGTAIVADAARGRPGDLPALVRSGATTAAAFDRDRRALRALVRNLRVTATAFARERDALERSLGEAPRVLDRARPALAAANRALPPARALAREAVPGVRRATPVLRDAVPLVRELGGLLGPRELGGVARDARPAVPALARLVRDAAPALRELRPASSCLNEVTVPYLNDTVGDKDFPAKGPVHEEFAKSLPGLAGASRSGDANGQWLRVLFQAGNYAYPAGPDQFLVASRPLMGANPPKPARGLPPLRRDVPCETQERPDLNSEPSPPPPGFEIDTTSPAAKALEARSLQVARRWLGRVLDKAGLDRRVTVADEALGLSDLPRVTGKLP